MAAAAVTAGERGWGAVRPGAACTTLRRILIVDDDAALRHSLAEQLQLHEEFQAGEAESAAAALDDREAASISTPSCSMSACPTWTGASCAG